MAGLGVQRHLLDAALQPCDAARLGITPQVARVQAGVEVVGVGDVVQRRVLHITRRPHEAVLVGRRAGDRELAQVRRAAGLEHLQPVLVEGHGPQVLPEAAEGVHVTRALAAPVQELDAQLETALGLADEFILVDLQHAVEELDHRDRRLADADGADLLALHQRDGDLAAQDLGQGRGGHPAGGAAAGDHDLPDHRGRCHGVEHPTNEKTPSPGSCSLAETGQNL